MALPVEIRSADDVLTDLAKRTPNLFLALCRDEHQTMNAEGSPVIQRVEDTVNRCWAQRTFDERKDAWIRVNQPACALDRRKV